MAAETIRLTMSQALVRYLVAQQTVLDGATVPLIPGVFAIFGHGNVAGLGEALAGVRDVLPTHRAHNEQAMAHAAIAYAKAMKRRQFMACTTSIGPGATNMVTAAALAHVNRLPVLLLPGDVFASRRPDPVLQQVEDFSDPTVTANDCFRPVSRYWDRITRPEQLLRSLPQALGVLTDPAECGPVTLALPQDVQAEAWDYPRAFFEKRIHVPTRPGADTRQLATAAELIARAKQPILIAGGGVHYSEACEVLAQFATRHGIPVAETQAGKGALPWDHPLNVGAIGVTGSARSERARRARGPGSRSGHAPAGFHDRFAHAVSEPAAALRVDQRLSPRCRKERRRCSPGRCGTLARRARRPPRRTARPRGSREAHQDAACVVARRGRRGDERRRRRAAERCASPRCGEPHDRSQGHSRMRCGRLAGRVAQAVARAGCRRVSPRVRLLVHGLRDRGRPGRQARAVRSATSS